MRAQDSLSALEKLRNELDILTANSSAASASQKSMESGWSFFESEVEQAGALSTGLHGALAPDDGWQNTMESLKEQISALASAVKDYSSVTNALQVCLRFLTRACVHAYCPCLSLPQVMQALYLRIMCWCLQHFGRCVSLYS